MHRASLQARLAESRRRHRIIRGGLLRGGMDYTEMMSIGMYPPPAQNQVLLPIQNLGDDSEDEGTVDSDKETEGGNNISTSQDPTDAALIHGIAEEVVGDLLTDVRVEDEQRRRRDLMLLQRENRRKKSRRNNYNRRSLQKEVVEELMRDVGDTVEDGKVRKNYRCLKCDHLCSFDKNAGWTNPASHCKICFERDDLTVRFFNYILPLCIDVSISIILHFSFLFVKYRS